MSIDDFDNKLKGDIGETAVALKLLKAGLNVFKPVGDRLPYDLLVEKNGVFKRIQCKYRKPDKKGMTRIKLANRFSSSVEYTKETIDAIAIYCPETELVAFINIEEIKPGTDFQIRFRMPKQHMKNILYAQQFIEPLRLYNSSINTPFTLPDEIKLSRKAPRPATRKVKRPSYAQLKNDLIGMSILAIGRKYGVSDNAVRKWIKLYERN